MSNRKIQNSGGSKMTPRLIQIMCPFADGSQINKFTPSD